MKVLILVLFVFIVFGADCQAAPRSFCERVNNLTVKVVETPNPCDVELHRCIATNQYCTDDTDCSREEDVLVQFGELQASFPFYGYMMNYLPFRTKTCFSTEFNNYYMSITDDFIVVIDRSRSGSGL